MDNKKTLCAKRLIVGLTTFAAIMAICLTAGKVGQYELNVGDISTADVYSPRTIIDKTTTNAQREAAERSVQPAYKRDNELQTSALDRLNDFFSLVRTVRNDDAYENTDARVAILRSRIKVELDVEYCETMLTIPNSTFEKMAGAVTDAVDSIMSDGVADKDDAMELFQAKMENEGFGESIVLAATALGEQVISENLTVDEAATQKRKDEASAAVVPIEYKKNQTLVRKGEIVTQAQIDMLGELGLLKGTSAVSVRYTVGVTLLLVMCFLLIGAYIMFCDPKLGRNIGCLVIIAIVSSLTVAMSFYLGRYLGDTTRCILPMGLAASLIAVFADPKIAMLVNMCLSFFGAIGVQHDWSYGVCLIISGSITAFCFSRVKRRVDLIPATLLSSIGCGMSFACMAMLETEDIRGILIHFAMGVLGGFISGIITSGSMSFWELCFDVLTPMKLNELSNPESKLLKKLLIQAPGTYHHSLTVANIAEIAARSIGADSVLARVGAYYHDIGKINHPLYFKENQYNENPHDKMDYADSARVIISHVPDGLAIAAQYHLPHGIRDIIAQHHGTTNTGYFYKRALAQNPDVDETAFSYPGPKPQTKEAAIVMLCDGCEAAVRSLSSKDEAEIDKMVRGLIKARLESGQLNECDMTFGDLETVTECIIKTLGGYFHERIQY